MRGEICRTAENFVTLRTTIFGVLNSATLMLRERKRIRVDFLTKLTNKLWLWQRTLGFGKIEFILADGEFLVFEYCGFATMICVFFVQCFSSGRAVAVSSFSRFVLGLDIRRAWFEFLCRWIFLFLVDFKRRECACAIGFTVRRWAEQRS